MEKKLIIVTGVSGSGKSSIVAGVLAQNVGRRIITCTTRAARMNNGVPEVDGIDYFFLSNEEFEKQRNASAFAEYELNYGKHYGTRKKDIEIALSLANIAFAIVDTKGAKSLIEMYPNATSIFIDVSKNDIRNRLVLRGDSQKSTIRRLAEFESEREQSSFFDIIIPNRNGKLNVSIAKLLEITQNEDIL